MGKKKRKIPTFGMVRRFVVNGLNPRFLRVNVRYVTGGFDGMNSIRPMMYSGQRS